MRFAKTTSSSVSVPSVSRRFPFFLGSSLQPVSTKQKLVVADNARFFNYSCYHSLAENAHKTSDIMDIGFHRQNHAFSTNYSTNSIIIGSDSSRNNRLFGSVSSPKNHKQKSKNGTRRSKTQRSKKPKKLSNMRNNHDRPASSKSRRGGNRKQQKNTKNSAMQRNRTNTKNTGTKHHKNDDRVSSSFASSAIDKWNDDSDVNHGAARVISDDDHYHPIGGTSRDDSKGDFHSIASRRSSDSFHLDRFLDKRQEFCESIEDYRLFWYPKSEKRQHHLHDTNGWKVAVTFEHPDPNENFPWLDLSWEKLVESEDLFRKVCASHHDLFVSCASYVTDLSDTHQRHPHYHHQNNEKNIFSTSYNNRQQPEANDIGEDADNDDDLEDNWTKQDLILQNCEDLLTTILPTWERIRRERALLVDTFRPLEDDEDVPFSSQQHQQLQQQQEEVFVEEESNNSNWNEQTTNDASYQNNKWVGWLKQIIPWKQEDTEDALDEDFDPVSAHLKPECAPNHYHYNKLVGRLYFHYLPLERHSRSNPFHYYNRTEREEDRNGVTSRKEYGDRSGTDMNSGNDDANRNHDYQEELASWERQKFEILQKRAEKIQYVIDQSLIPLTPATRNNNTSNTNQQQKDYHRHYEDIDSSDRVLSDKIVRLLIRSYLDIGSFSAAQQAERVYHRHLKHRKRLLWYVTMCYLKVITSNNKELARVSPADHNSSGKSSSSRNNHERRKRLFLQRNQESSTAAQRICELVSSKHAKEAREFQHCSTIAFEALATLSEHGRRGLKGYYDRVHSLGILKFGPKVWETLLKETDSSSIQTTQGRETGNQDRRSRHRRKRKTHRKSSVDASSVDKATLSHEGISTAPAATAPIDLSQALHSKDYKILNYLIQIYSNEDKNIHRALRLLQVSLDLYSPNDLKESLQRSTFHKLLQKLSEQKRRVSVERQKKKQHSQASPKNAIDANGSGSGCGSDSSKPDEFDIALDLLESMLSDAIWFPNEETFRILFSMIPYSANPGEDAERLQSKLEVCRFLSDLSTNSSPSHNGMHHSSGEGYQQHDLPFPEAPPILSPLEASTLTLRAWLQTLQQHGGVLPSTEPHKPSQRALSILRVMKVGSTSLFGRDGIIEYEAKDSNNRIENSLPTTALYCLALEVCYRDNGSPRASLDAALDIFEMLRIDGLLLEETACLALLGVLADFSNNINIGSSEEHQDLLLARVVATRRLCHALVEEDPSYRERKPKIRQFLHKQSTYVRLRHPELYEEHLAELGLLDDAAVGSDGG